MPPIQDRYKVKLLSVAQREEQIRAAVEASIDSRDFHEFRNQTTKLPLVRIPENVLVYRMENFRTYIAQHEYVRTQNSTPDFFKFGQESETAQQVQNDILEKLAKQGRSDSVTPVIDVLRKEGQREPLLITFRGVVVNGNRRLAGMRSLFTEDPADFSHLEYIDCLVLPPDATASEIVEIEAALQAKPETRLDYDWIGDCQLIQKMLDLGKTIEQIGTRLNRKPAEISNSLAALVEANLYLKDWAGADGDFGRVVDSEQLFKDIPSLLQSKSAPQAEASRVLAWNLLENKKKLGVRLYAFNNVIAKHATQVLQQVTADLDLSSTSINDTKDDTFAVDFGSDGGATSLAPLIDELRGGPRKEEATDCLVEACRDVLEAERSKSAQNAALKAVNAAMAKLGEVNLGAAERSTYPAISNGLDNILQRVNGLKSLLQKLSNDNDG